ncbi:MAG TPA: hypothetical protein VFH71_04845 [Rhodanobacteraceae bacterium]|nr:hypothetical protein [Rhodanobacteraceae bacterium]
MKNSRVIATLALAALGICAFGALAQTPTPASAPDAKFFSQMQWRAIGPMRGGRMRALDGVASQPNVFYAGADNGGVWKSTDYGESWFPIFDSQPTGSIGAIAVAPSDPNIIYVGSGEGIIRPDGTIGDGMYKSTDAGKTWTHLGLRDTQKISQVIVDPHDPDRLFVAAIGHPYGPNEERGIFRSTDGGKTFQKVLYKDAYTSGEDVDFDPSNPQIVYATLWQQQQAPWENGSFEGTSGGLFKSTDGGSTWKPIGTGLPKVIQMAVAVAPSDPQRLYASVASEGKVGIYRSNDGGASWTKATDDKRPAARIGGGDLPTLAVDPKNPDVVYSNTPVLWKSADAGKTWTAFRGAPGGDDYQQTWINPNDPSILLVTSDQGAIVTVNDGKSWSSWYNQPTAAMYKVGTDNAWPYRVCGGQQDSGSACVSSRGNDGEITAHDWHPAGIEEYGAAAPDPLDPDIVYGGKVTRYDRRTGQIADVGPKALRGDKDYRVLRTMPLQFSPIDPHLLYFASNVVWTTRDGGQHWQQISPDLTRHGDWKVPASTGKYADTKAAKPSDRGVVYALAPSPLDINRIWAGTDDGLIQLTTDGGKTWKNVTPKQMKPWWKVFAMDASHFDPGTAYAAINTLRLDDMRPHLFRTRDGGKTWTEIDNGIADGAVTNVIREDPKTRGLLFAGSETQTWVSFDDGDHWQSLRLNMPAISVRDLQVKDDDLVAATHGRGYWILDDITPLRQINAQTARAPVTLYRPELATRVRWGMNPPTPWRVPATDNPPPGAIIDYYLAGDAHAVTLDILDANGKLVRHYASSDAVKPIDPDKLDIPPWWPRPPQSLSARAGEHRFLWDMHYAPVPGLTPMIAYDEAVVNQTPQAATSPWVMPGQYTVKLTVDGRSFTQPLAVRMDPRVQTSSADLQKQFDASMHAYDETVGAVEALGQIRDLQKQLQARQAKAHSSDKTATDYAKQLEALAGPLPKEESDFPDFRGPPTLDTLAWSLRMVMGSMQNADKAPTDADIAALDKTSRSLDDMLARWKQLQGQPLADVNARLQRANLAVVAVHRDAPPPPYWDEQWITTDKDDQ